MDINRLNRLADQIRQWPHSPRMYVVFNHEPPYNCLGNPDRVGRWLIRKHTRTARTL